MVNLTLKFVECCRAGGLRVSTSEVLDCVNQLKLIDLIDERQYKTVVRSNFTKTHRDHAAFDQLYNLFFHNVCIEKTIEKDGNLNSYYDEINEALKDQAGDEPLEKAIADFLSGNPLAYIEEIQKLRLKEEDKPVVLKSNMGQLTNRLQVMLALNKTKDKMLQFLGDNHSNSSEEVRKKIELHFTDLLQRANDLLSKDPKPYNESLKEVKTGEKRLTQLGDQPFSSFTQSEVEEVREVITKLVRRLKDIVSLRYLSKNKGILDIKKTLRSCAKYNGVPLEIEFKNRPMRKSKVLALCDVSGSVWLAARFMLNILYSLQDCFNKVRSFIFVSGLAEATEFFEDFEINEAVEKILKDVDIKYDVPTDYGQTFQEFKKNYINILDRKTTLIIIGDARSNYLNPKDDILGEMREKCRRVIWLNPEPEILWDTGDSEMFTYKPYCHEVRVCQNLNQLICFIEELVL